MPLFSMRGRAEYLICIGRFALVTLSLAAGWLVPAQEPLLAGGTVALLAAYAAYAAILVMAVPRALARLDTLQVTTHTIDLVALSALVYFTDGAISPFLVYLVFVLVAATLRWQWRGTVWTAGVLLVFLAGLGVYDLVFLARSPSDLHHFDFDHLVLMMIDLLVVAALLSFLGWAESRTRAEIERLADWARDVPMVGADSNGLSRMLEHAARAMQSRRALFAWDAGEEPWVHLAYWDGSTTVVSRATPVESLPLVAPEYDGMAFLSTDGRGGGGAQTIFYAGGELRRCEGSPVSPALAERFDIDRVISVPVQLEEGAGRLFLLDGAPLVAEDLTLASVVAGAVSSSMSEVALRDELGRVAVLEERVRLASDLHDGVLQSLTGTALQLETARRLLDRDVAAAGRTIESAQSSLVREQRDLRTFIDALTPERAGSDEPVPDLPTRLLEQRESVSQQWGIGTEVLLDVDERTLEAVGGLAADIAFIVNEGLVNSARHANATNVRAVVRPSADGLQITLEDDGRGFGFTGRLDDASLRAQGIGPHTLMRRVQTLGGTLAIDSSPAGSRIEITLPFPPDGADAEDRVSLREIR